MSRFIKGIFGGQTQSPPATALRVTTSLQGVAIAIILGGQGRMAGNLIDYFGFASHGGGGGGKGGIAGGGKGQSQTSYSTSFILAVCEGPIAAFTGNWINANFNYFSQYGVENDFLGDLTQEPWSGAQIFEPSRALAYRGLAYVASLNFNLGTSPSLPQINMEVRSLNSFNTVPGQPDGDPTIAFTSFLTNPDWGIGFPPARLAALGGTPSAWQSYCKALGFGVTPIISDQVSAASAMSDLTDATNSAPCWQDGQMTVVPYGDTAVAQGALTEIAEQHIVPNLAPNTLVSPIIVGNVGTFVQDDGVNYTGGSAFTLVAFPPSAAGTYSQANGTYYFSSFDVGQQITISYTFAAAASYIPDTEVLYDFTISDFLTNQGTVGTGLAAGNSPIVIVRKPRDQMTNSFKVEYLDRNNAYNPVNIEVKDSASITVFKRIRPSDVKQYHFFCLASAAVQSATLRLVRSQVARTFQWTCGKHFMMILSLMKIVTLTLPSMGLARQPVRIIEIQENTDQTLTVTAEDFNGTASAPIYGTEASVGHQINYNVDPGAVNTPILFEPTDELGRALISGGGLMLAVAVSGQSEFWGGANVWVSYDGQQYTQVGVISGPARMGVLSAQLAGAIPNATGAQTIDTTSTLSVDLTESNGTLDSVSQIDATSLNTRSLVGPLLGQPGAGSGEIVAYENATLTAASEYDLTFLVRGAYGTEDEISVWPAGTGFVRLDDRVLAIPFDKSRIGSTIFIKLVSFNIFLGAVQSLADVPAFSYTIQGLALASPLPTLENLRTVFSSGRLAASWDEITDFRGAIRVEVRQGNTFDTALSLGTVAHPPFTFPGDGTYWFTAWCQPASGLIVRSEQPLSIAVSGTTQVTNKVGGFDCKANNWPGTFVSTSVDVGTDAVRLDGGQMMTTAPTAAGGNVLTFATVPVQVVPGLTVTDLSDAGVIPAGTTVVSTTETTVTISNPVGADWQPADFSSADFGSRGVLTGDTIEFGTEQILTMEGTYSPAFAVDCGRPVSMTVTISLLATGVPVAQNILDDPNILANPDVLGSTAAKFIDVAARVLVSQDGVTFAPSVKYSPGDYFGRALKFEFDLSTVDPGTAAFLLSAIISVQVPTRTDHILTNAPLSAGGLAVSFTPDGASTPAPFNGGPNGTNVPHILATWGDEQAGDVFRITNLSLSGATFQIQNSGIGVTRNNVNILAEGF